MSNSPVRRSLSIVTTLYNSAATIEEFCRRSAAAAEALALSFEIVIVAGHRDSDRCGRRPGEGR